MVLIPSDYYDGRNTLELEIPWVTPEAITWLDKRLTKKMSAVDYGTGGSTLFLARRCDHVISMDNNPRWIINTREALKAKSLLNASVYDVSCIEECKSLVNRHFDVALIDCCNISRYDLAVYMKDRADIVVIDNYSADYVGNTDAVYAGWNVERYDDVHWQGSGTKIYWRAV